MFDKIVLFLSGRKFFSGPRLRLLADIYDTYIVVLLSAKNIKFIKIQQISLP